MKKNSLLKLAFLLLFVLNSVEGFSQKWQVEGTIRDSETNVPVNAAGIILKNSSRGVSANEQGYFRIELLNFPAVLFIQCMGYVRDTIIIANESQFLIDFKGKNRVFLLKKSIIQLNEVQVKAQSTLFEKDPYAIIDYKIFGNRIVAMGYKNGNEFRKEVLLGNLNGKMISNHSYKNLDSIFQDCQGNAFAFCNDSVLELKLTRNRITIQDSYTRDLIKENIVPVCGLADSIIFLKKSSPNHQYDNYFAIRDSQNVMFIYSTGKITKELQSTSENNAWTQKGQVMITLVPPGGCTGGCIDRWLELVYEPAYHNYFASHFKLLTDFPSVFTKMISLHENFMIFDREAASISFINQNGRIFKEVGMNTRLNGLKYQDIHIDSGTGKVYVEYPQGAFTHFIEINPESGQEIRRFLIRDFRHIEKCEFLNDRLYFLYQPDMGKRIKKLYSIWI